MTELTDQQQTAVTTRGTSVVLSSGAGCGKTSVLTARYLSQLQRDQFDVSQMVAITFTDKAAREMRQRIRDEVERHAQSAESNRAWWQAQVRGLETASITTIHSFCASLLRNYALDAGLDPGFQVLEEVIAPNLKEKCLEATLFRLLTAETSEGHALRELVRWYGWSTVRKAIGELVNSADSEGWYEWLTQTPEAIVEGWRHVASREIVPAYMKRFSVSGEVLGDTLALLKNLPPPNAVFAERQALILDKLPKLDRARDPAQTLKAIREAAKVQGACKKTDWPGTANYDRIGASFKKFRDVIDKKLLPLFEEPDDLELVAQFGQKFLTVSLACQGAFAAEKSQRGYVDFQDLLVLTRNLFRDRPRVRDELRGRYRAILVDELQDTDRVQMELISQLCGYGLKQGKLFAVGDAKQSIYRFRGAVVEEFERLREAMPDRGRQTLSVNFRSQPGVVHFVNKLLEGHMANYEPLVSHRKQTAEGPIVEFLWSDTGDNVTVSRRREAKAIANRIIDMIGQGMAEPKDIVLLFRAMTNVAIYEEALRDAGLDYYLVGGRAFFAQQEVYDLLNLLRTLENPHDTLALAGVLRSPFGCMSDEGLFLLAQHRDGLWRGLCDSAHHRHLPTDDRKAARRILEWVQQWRAVKDRLPIAGLINRVLADSGYDAALQFEMLGDRKLANLWKLIDQARTFDSAGGLTLADFVQRLSELVQTPPREEQAATQPEESNVIRLMSIHQSKGLEFPVVIVPDLNAKSRGPSAGTALWDHRFGCVPRPPADEEPAPFSDWPGELWKVQEGLAEYDEDLRTLYVACTRAKDYLVLSASLPSPIKAESTAMKVLLERFDATSGECRHETLSLAERPQVRVTKVNT